MNTRWKKELSLGAQVRLIATATIASGEGILKQGQVLAMAGELGSEKFYKLVRETAVANEDTGINSNTLDGLRASFFAAKRMLVPGTVSVNVEGNTITNDAADDGHGRLLRSDDTVVGAVDYETGQFDLSYPANPTLGAGNATISYRYRNQDGKSDPVAVLMDYEVDTSSADQPAAVQVLGDVNLDEVIWPANISAANKQRAIRALEARGIFNAN